MKATQSPLPPDMSGEISTLIETLLATERRLVDLTAGEVDAVAGRDGRTFLLQRAQEQLRQNEGFRQAAILNALPAHIALLDGQGVIVSVNDAWRRFGRANGFQRDAGVGMNYPEVCDRAQGSDSSEAHQVAAGIRSVLKGSEREFSIEYPCHSPTEQRWFMLTVSPLMHESENGAVAMHVDITARKRGEMASTRLAAVIESSQDAIIGKDLDRIITSWNSGAEAIFGYTANEMEGTSILRLNPPDRPDDHHHILEQIKRGERVGHFETVLQTKGGALLDFSVTASPIKDPGGRVIGISIAARDITERKRTEQALSESEEHFRFLNELNEATRTLADPEQIMAVMSRLLGEQLGASRCAYADVLRDGERFTIPHDYTDGCASTVGEYQLSLFGPQTVATLNGGQTLIIRNVEKEMLPGEGADMFNAIGIKAVICCPLVKDGVLRAMMAVHQTRPRAWKPSEIALVEEVVERCWATIERRTAEENLRQSESLLRIAGRTARLGGWSVSLPAVHAIWSDEVCAIHDVPPGTRPAMEQAIGFYAPHSRETIAQAFAACAQDGIPYDLELEVITAKGRLIWVRGIGEARRNAAGAIVAVQGAFQDVTERKRASDALRTSEKRFRALFDQAAVGVAQTDVRTGRFIQVNQRYCDIVGRSGKELVELTFSDITHPQDVESAPELVRRLREGEIREFSRERRYVRKDLSEVWVNLTVSAMWAPGEAPDYAVAILQDITGQKLLEDQFRQAQKMEAIGTLAGGIAHDFNNVLAAVTGYTELAKRELPGNVTVLSYLDAVLQGARRATDLVRQILAFSRQQALERKSIQLREVVGEALSLLRATIPKTIEFDVSIADAVPNVLADTSQIHQVIMNLCTNAAHAMKNGPGRLTVKLEKFKVDTEYAFAAPGLRVGNYVLLSISDTGTGMDEATKRRIFEPFFTTKAPGEGTGLGLAVVHGIMQNHDGAVTVYSHLGEGTTFHLYFPEHTDGEIQLDVESTVAPWGAGERILYVDDEEPLAIMGKKILERLGYVVDLRTSAAEALAAVTERPEAYDLVITDQMMPRMTGTNLAAKIHAISADLPIILTTGYSATLTAESVRVMGIRKLLFKPLTFDALGKAVSSVLKNLKS